MIELLQIINHMLNLKYDHLEIDEAFVAVINGDETIESLFYALNLENPTQNQIDRINRALPKWESAYHVYKMRQGA